MGMGLLFSRQRSVVGCQDETGQPLWFRVSGNHHLTERGCGLAMAGQAFTTVARRTRNSLKKNLSVCPLGDLAHTAILRHDAGIF
jgi:hypothetical protein